jgi:hypothetical protein
MVTEMDEEQRARTEAILARSYELTAETDRLLAEPRPEMTYQPPQPARYRGFQIELVDDMLKATEARINKRIDELEGRFQGLWQGVEGLADESGTALGEVERKVRDEFNQQLKALRNDLLLLRAGSPSRRQKEPRSRAPFKLDDENAYSN